MDIRPADRVGIVGDNGAGKSTIARLVLGLYRPQAGAIRLFGTEVRWRHHFPLLGYIGDPATVEGALALPADLRVGGLLDSYAELFARSGWPLPHGARLLQGLHLSEPSLRRSRIGTLSRGERQRVLAFLALAKGPELLVADEASEGLDAQSRGLILSCVQQIGLTRPMAVLWISHRYDEIVTLATQVYELREGHLQARGTEGFRCHLETEATRAAYPGIPAATVLGLLAQALLTPETRHVRFTAERCNGPKEIPPD